MAVDESVELVSPSPSLGDRRGFIGQWASSGIMAGMVGGPRRAKSQDENSSATSVVSWNKAKRVLFLFASGGPSHLDTFDPKPNAPEDIRGAFRSILTSAIPGQHFSS